MDHGGCAILVGVENNRIVKIKGDPEGLLNKGYICAKGLAAAERLTNPNRLKHPLKRMGPKGAGKWQKCSWEEALQTISENLLKMKKDHGAKSVVFGQGMPKGLEHFGLIRLANTFGSPNVLGTQDVCHAPREITGIHTCGFYPVADFHNNSKLAILWGSNITDTNEEGAINRLFLDQFKKGMDLIVVDPRRTSLAEKAKYWLQLKPGTDNALALGFLHVIITEKLWNKQFVAQWTHGFEELAAHVKKVTPEKISDITWVSPDLIRKSARLYAKSHPAVIQWGNAIEHHKQAFDTCRALVCLMALCGNLDTPGGNIQADEPVIERLGKLVRADLLPSKPKDMIHAHHHTIPKMMTVPPTLFHRAVLEEDPYPVKGAYLQCTNPLVCHVDSQRAFQAFMKLDFLAVSDIFMTPTASVADIVLPAATTFEFNDIGHAGLGHGVILARPKVVAPPDECWPDIRILNELGNRITSKDLWYNEYETFLEELLKPANVTYREFENMGYLAGKKRFYKYKDNGFKTPSKKVELTLSNAEKLGCMALPQLLPDTSHDPEYPLILTTRKSPFYLHSSYRWVESLRKRHPVPITEIHPDTALKYHIKDDHMVVIETPAGSIRQTAHVTDKIHPDVIYADYGWWFPEKAPEKQYDWQTANYNMLTTAKKVGREFGTPDLKGIHCRIRPK